MTAENNPETAVPADAEVADTSMPPSESAPPQAGEPDGFALLAAIGSAPAAFPDAADEARTAARAILLRQAAARGLGLDGVRAIHGAVGPDAFAAFLPAMRPADLSRLACACDPHKPGLAAAAPESQRAHLVALAQGAAPAAAADIGDIDVAGLREARARLGEADFATWLAALRVNEMKRALQRLDPHRPGLVGMETEALRGVIERLSAGEEPVEAADLGEIDLDALRALRGRLGEDGFPAWLASLRVTETKKALQRLDPHRPGLAGMDPEAMRALMDRLSAGEEPVTEVELATLDVEGLRAARTYLGEGFPAWLAGLRATEARKTLQRLDPHRPGLSSLDLDGLRAHLGALADGTAEPSPAIPLDEVDLAGLGAAREAIGPEAFEVWLAELKPADVKRTVIRLDPERPGVRKLRPGEYAEILATLAERMAPYSGRSGTPGVTEITFGRARHDEERYPDEASADEA